MFLCGGGQEGFGASSVFFCVCVWGGGQEGFDFFPYHLFDPVHQSFFSFLLDRKSLVT